MDHCTYFAYKAPCGSEAIYPDKDCPIEQQISWWSRILICYGWGFWDDICHSDYSGLMRRDWKQAACWQHSGQCLCLHAVPCVSVTAGQFVQDEVKKRGWMWQQREARCLFITGHYTTERKTEGSFGDSETMIKGVQVASRAGRHWIVYSISN